MEADTKKAIADAAYEIQKQEQQKTIEAATVNARIAKAEREAELRAKEVDVRQKTLDAEIGAKAVAEAEGIDRKAEAMKKYGEAAVIEMVMNSLPEIAKNVAEPLSKADHITMYGEGNSAKLLQDIVNGTSQVTEGISRSMGIDFKSLVAGMVGGKLMAQDKTAPQVIVQTGETKTGPKQEDQSETHESEAQA